MRRAYRVSNGRFFYGWVIVGVMFMVGFVSIAMGTLNLGLFINPMSGELGLGRVDFGWAMSARQMAAAAVSPALGWLIDRYGARGLLALAGGITGAAMVSLAFISQSWQLIVLFAIMGVAQLAGPMALLTSVPVAKWFVRRRARAISIAAIGGPIGGVIFMPLSQVLIDDFGWRMAWSILGVSGAVIIVPLALMLVRRQPEDMGLMPDGLSHRVGLPRTNTGSNGAVDKEQSVEVSWTLNEAIRSPRFWQLVLAFSVMAFAMSTVALHRIPQFVDRGIDPLMVSYAISLEAGLAGVVTLAVGLVAHRVPPRILGGLCFVGTSLAIVFTIVADTTVMVFVSMAVFGIGVGGMLLIQSYLWPEYFGRKHVGKIRGLVMPATVFFAGVGAPFAGYVRDVTGTYNTVWWVSTVLMLFAAVVMLTTRPPIKKFTVPPISG